MFSVETAGFAEEISFPANAWMENNRKTAQVTDNRFIAFSFVETLNSFIENQI